MLTERREFYSPQKIVEDVEDQVGRAQDRGERVDYLTFVPDGEPTLDNNLGREIRLLKPLGIKIAVISNASLLWREDVRSDLQDSDWVSLKVDAVSEVLWRRVNRPHGKLNHEAVMEGMREFADDYGGELATETMLIQGVNDGDEELEKIAGFLSDLDPDRPYLAIPTRPPAEKWVKSADEQAMNKAFQIFEGKLRNVEYLIGYEGNAFAFTGNVENDLLSITSVHPMREEGVQALLKKADSDWSMVDTLMEEDKLVETEYLGKKFYLRKLAAFES